ncbi:hypothetical protein DVB69_07680 [Sporosarcina sp. BI001-red]|uniref:hypothetical protein n=1 Tax=Sporosarcina sp. BI001-red TaxID=2282866 RepID=UPI000E24C081|nr:hypothetical protein [Sporosarcina sp. BI001-red]REB07860.1 hypothetical protein DVB69_07680 [Sporosarcina sp. BI001-red]
MANRTIRFILLMALLILSACSPQPRTDVKPVQEAAEQPISSPPEKKELGRPGEFYAWSGNEVEGDSDVILGDYCWSENGTSCTAESDDPRELMFEERYGKTRPGERIQFSMAINPTWTWLSENDLNTIQGTRIDVIQISDGIETSYENVGDHLDAPMEPGFYFYLATVTWDLEVKGQANYAFAFSVSPDY